MYYHPHFTKEKMGSQKENHTDSKWLDYCQTKCRVSTTVLSPRMLTAELHPVLAECLSRVEGTFVGLGEG